jgi:hypothetical protein
MVTIPLTLFDTDIVSTSSETFIDCIRCTEQRRGCFGIGGCEARGGVMDVRSNTTVGYVPRWSC